MKKITRSRGKKWKSKQGRQTVTRVGYRQHPSEKGPRRGAATIRVPYLARLLGTILDRY